MKKFFAVMLAVCMVFSMSALVMAADALFTDVDADAWYAEDVAYVYENELMVGVGEDKFAPESLVTRAMVWATIARMADADKADSDPWWLESQKWMVENELSDGLRENANTTREEVVTMLYRYAAFEGADVSETANILSYTDAEEVSNWAMDAMQWACAIGLVKGVSEDTLAPQDEATRAQLAALLHRYMEEVIVKDPEPVDPPHEHTYTTEAGYHKCDRCSVNEMCTPKVVDGEALICAVCGKDYIVAAEATFEKENIAVVNEDGAGLESYGNVAVKDVTMKAGTANDYAMIFRGGNADLENVAIDSTGGGIGAVNGAKVSFDGGSVAVNTDSTSGRYNIYAVDEGTEVTIKGGDFSFSKTLNQKRAYIYVGEGATVKVEGGNFGPASKRDGYTDGILGDGNVIITGGTFGFDPTKWVAEGYVALKDGKTWTVTKCEDHDYTTEKGYHKCDICSFTEMCTPNVADGEAVTCAVCGEAYIVAAEATFEKENIAIINKDGAGLESYGTVTLKDVAMEAGTPNDYAMIFRGGNVTLENVALDSAGGGIGVTGGAKVSFDGGSVAVNTKSTSGRYNFYVVGEGSEATIKGGDFSFSKTLNQKRAYIYVGEGATVKVEGGNFGPASKRDGYTAGIMGDGKVIITGGTFGFDPTKWVAEGYEAVKDGNVWTVSVRQSL